MYLIKNDLVSYETKIKISFEIVCDDLLMINISNYIQSHGILSYWRLTKVIGIPPLEIGIDCQEGFISSITFFVDGYSVSMSEEITPSSIKGNIKVDTSIFTKTNDYIDIEQPYEISINDRNLICAFENKNKFNKAFRNDRLEIFVDCNNQIVGFSICDLSEAEKKMINNVLKTNSSHVSLN